MGNLLLKLWKNYRKWKNESSRNGYGGIGKPEALRGEFSGWWSRRIDDANRLIYRLVNDGSVEISQCRGHYDDK